jgi:predicted ribosome quality control (RQC) complex YloA/Tae2 family protein
MYPDAFTTNRLANELNEWLKSCSLKSIFSTSKSDLFFVFSEKKGFKIQFFQGQAFFQFLPIETFPVKNRMLWFNSIHDMQLLEITSHANSRSFELLLTNQFRLVFKLFGKFSNLILFDQNLIPKEIFQLNFKKDLETPYSSYAGNTSDIATLKAINFDIKDFTASFPWFGNDAINCLNELGYFTSSDPISKYEEFEIQYKTKEIHIAKQANNTFELSCFPLPNSIGTYLKIRDAFNDFTHLYIGSEAFKNKKLTQISNLEKQIHQKLKLKTELQRSLETIKNKRSYSQIGDLIMANLHSIHNGVSKIEVFDFYNNSKISLKLRTDLNPQQNATLYYQKSKNEVKELDFKQKAFEEVNAQIDKLIQKLEQLIEADNTKALRSFDKTAVEIANTKLKALPYRIYKLDEFEILVGKNAKANDELLSKFTSKNDTWLHAKDVSGSHVIIKNPGAKPIPVNILEQVASLAAWYSKSKTNSLSPVIYTLRKYVRKMKGAPAGKVIVEREKTLLVEPKDLF